MGTIGDEAPLLENDLLQNEKDNRYTGDGSVDIHGNPVLKENTGKWRACPFILGNECCERLAYYGIAANLVNYLTGKLHEGNVSAARNVTTWSGTCYLTPLIGAVLADAFWGRYWTIAVFSTIYFIVAPLPLPWIATGRKEMAYKYGTSGTDRSRKPWTMLLCWSGSVLLQLRKRSYGNLCSSVLATGGSAYGRSCSRMLLCLFLSRSFGAPSLTPKRALRTALVCLQSLGRREGWCRRRAHGAPFSMWRIRDRKPLNTRASFWMPTKLSKWLDSISNTWIGVLFKIFSPL